MFVVRGLSRTLTYEQKKRWSYTSECISTAQYPIHRVESFCGDAIPHHAVSKRPIRSKRRADHPIDSCRYPVTSTDHDAGSGRNCRLVLKVLRHIQHLPPVTIGLTTMTLTPRHNRPIFQSRLTSCCKLPMSRSIIFAFVFLFFSITSHFNSCCEAASPTGTWRGGWSSESTGHKGALRARIRPIDADTYRAVFVGRFAGVIPFIYPATLQRVPGQCDCYTSSQRLPLLGTYRMTASVSSQRFYATFGGKKDSGTFDMQRTP